MASNAIAGTVDLTIDGQIYQLAGEFKYSPGSMKRESLSGMDSVHGYKQTPTPPYFEGSIRDSGGLTVGDFNTMDGVTVVATLANGKTVLGSNMWTVGEPQEVDTSEAKFTVRFEGPSGCITETTSS